MKTLKTTEAITKAINSIRNRGKKLDMDIHVCACSIAEHINQHHEISLMLQLFDAMPKGSRVNALKAWFLEFAKVNYDENTKEWSPKRAAAHDLTVAFETPWYEFKQEPEFQPIDSLELLKKALKTMEKALQGENADKHKIDPAHVTALQKVVNG